jgi:hypothetical protein
VAGTNLAGGRRTVVALRAVGLEGERRFTTYHRVLNRGVRSALVLSFRRVTGRPPGRQSQIRELPSIDYAMPTTGREVTVKRGI